MNDAPGSNGRGKPGGVAVGAVVADPAELSRRIAEIAERSQLLVAEFLSRQSNDSNIGMADPQAIGAAFFELTARLMADPARLFEAQMALWKRLFWTLWQSAPPSG